MTSISPPVLSEPRPRIEAHPFEFRRRRALNWLVLGLTYSAMYMGRYNLAWVNASLSSVYGWDKAQVGAIISTALLIYGVSAIFNGPVSDRMGGRRSMLIGATGSVAFNLLFGLGAYLGILGRGPLLLAYFATMWGLNAYFQSFSALSLIKVNASWFQIRERGVFSAIFGSMIQGGRLLIYVIAPILVTFLPWQWVFFVPAACVALMVAATYRWVRNSPEDCGFDRLDLGDGAEAGDERTSVASIVRKVFTNPVTLTIAVSEFCTGLLRHGFEQWFPRYMQEAQGLSLSAPIFRSGAVGVVAAGVLGAFFAGTLSDWVFAGRRTPVAFLGYLLQAACLLVIWRSPGLGWVMGAFVLNSFAISIVHSMLSGTASMDFGGRQAAATAAGLFDGMQYIGGSVVGIGMGWMLERFGWKAWGPSMIGFSVIGMFLMIALWNARPKSSLVSKR